MKRLKAEGWYVKRIRGSHHILSHPTIPEDIVLPMHKKDIPAGLLHAIMKIAGWK